MSDNVNATSDPVYDQLLHDGWSYRIYGGGGGGEINIEDLPDMEGGKF